MLHGQQTLVLTVESVNEALADYINKHLAGVRVDELKFGTSYNAELAVPLTVHVKMRAYQKPIAPPPDAVYCGQNTTERPLVVNTHSTTSEVWDAVPESTYRENQSATARGAPGLQPTPMSNSSLRGDTLYATPTGPKVLLHLEDNP